MDIGVNRRELILEAALALFSNAGYDATAVPEIAARAGVGTGTLYRHFPDKLGLFNALYQIWRSAFSTAVLAPMQGDLTPRAQFGVFWHRLLGWYRDHPAPARFLDLHQHTDRLDQASLAAQRKFELALRGFVRAGMRGGSLRAGDPELSLAAVRGMALALLQQDIGALHTGHSSLSDARIEEAGELVWRAIAA